MSVFLTAILIQTMYYAVVLFLSIGLVSLLLKSFFWKYVRVRLSFGRLLMLKIRTPVRDFFRVGSYEDGFIVFKHKQAGQKKDLRVSVEDNKPFYKCLSVNWVDISSDGQVCKADYSTASGFDLEKYSNLYTRTLMRPSIGSNYEKVVVALLVILCIGVLVALYLGYSNYTLGKTLGAQIAQYAATAKATIVGSTTNI